MAKHIQNVNIETLTQHFIQKGMNLKKPLLLAVDCDRTIVDRKKGSHVVSNEVISMFHYLRDANDIIVTINTGRDLTSYQPLQMQLLHSDPCVFLSGRVIRYQGQNMVLPKAILPETFCRALWMKFLEETIPFLDVKHAMGNTFFAQKNRNLRKYYGLYKPVDWFVNMIPYEYVASKHEDASSLLSLNCVRMELPFLKKEHKRLAFAIEAKDKPAIRKYMEDFFGIPEMDDLLFTPLLVHGSHVQEFSDIMYLRVMMSNEHSNKGLGVKYLSELFSIPQENIVCFGDSSGDTASDVAVKTIMPNSTLLITEDGDCGAISQADFLISNVEKNGVPNAISIIVEAYNACR